nr:MBL fold metallo-hydrolase [Actinospica durhamensis]
MLERMRIDVLGGCGAWPEAGSACSGFLVEHEGFRLLLDAGYATFPRLLELIPAAALDAVLISHGHPDHCADLNPLLRARALADSPPPALPVFAPPAALDAVLALDRPGMLDPAIALQEFEPGQTLSIGPFEVRTRLLPHWLPNAGVRLEAGGTVLAYTGDSGPHPAVVELARGADLLIAEATYIEQVPNDSATYLTSAAQAAVQAAQADSGRLLLTHLSPGTDADQAAAVAGRAFPGRIDVARSGLRVTL